MTLLGFIIKMYSFKFGFEVKYSFSLERKCAPVNKLYGGGEEEEEK